MRSSKIPWPVLLLAGCAGLFGWTLALLVLCRRIGVLGPGTDWLAFYGAARSYLEGNLALIFDPAQFTAYLNSEFGWWLVQPLAFRPWVYPPTFLLLLLPFGALPLVWSYILFELVGGTALLIALITMTDRSSTRWLIVISAFLSFGAAATVMQGQNGFLSAALLVGGWQAVRSYPLFGGVLLGMLSFKPQFCVLLPVALVAAREWRAFAAMIAAALVLAAASAAVFGIEIWIRWIGFALNPGDWTGNARIYGTSYFSFVSAELGLPRIAEAIQMAVTAASAVVVYRTFRGALPRDQQLAILLAATLIAAPHSSYYDTLLLAIAVTLWVLDAAGRGSALLRSEIALFVWTAPLFDAEVLRGSVPLLATAFIAVVLACRRRDAAAQPTITRDAAALSADHEMRAGRQD